MTDNPSPWIDDLDRDGYVVRSQIVAPEERENMALELVDFASWYAGPNGSLDEKLTRLDNIGRLGDLYDAMRRSPALLQLASAPGPVEHAKTILRSSLPPFIHDAVLLMQRPNDGRRLYGWHQDFYYSMPSPFVRMYLPVVRDSTIENGTITVLPGSHHEKPEQAYMPELPDAPKGSALQIRMPTETVAKYHPTPVEIPLGSATFFPRTLIHCSGINRSSRTRFVVVVTYHDAAHPEFRAPIPDYRYRGPSPGEAYEGRSNRD